MYTAGFQQPQGQPQGQPQQQGGYQNQQAPNGQYQQPQGQQQGWNQQQQQQQQQGYAPEQAQNQQFAQQQGYPQGQQQQGQFQQPQGQQQQFQPQQSQQQQQHFQPQQQQQGQQGQQFQPQQAPQAPEEQPPTNPTVATNSPARWSWSTYPANRIDGTRMVVPLGCMYTPLSLTAPTLPYQPLTCVKCSGILNPHCQVDYRSKTWGCALCNTRNSFPAHYAAMTEQHLPMELMKQYDTVEYAVPEQRPPPTFVFVVDTCIDTDEELEGLREYLLLAVDRLPPAANVGFITFGATVAIHELSGATEFPRSVVLRGSAEVTTESLKKLIPDLTRFVCPLADAEFALTSLIEDLQADAWPVPKDTRAMRCTGAAVSAAASLLEGVSPKVGSSILTFLSGVCTEGPGTIVETSRAVMIRTHNDLRDNTSAAQHYEKASQFYEGIMRRIVHQGHSLNVFSAALDQTGVAEMKPAIQASGGMILAADSWTKQPFRTSLDRFFERNEQGNLTAALNVTFDVITSPSWKVMGVIGQCIGTGKRSPSVAETEIGIGGTCQWTASIMDRNTTYAIYFETAQVPPERGVAGATRFVQFITTYQATNGERRVRVSTMPHGAMEKTDFKKLAEGFDQEAAAILVARQAVHKTDSMQLFDVLRWIDRTAIRLVARFGDYQKDVPQSLRLPQNFTFFPSFMYHLRRSAYLQVFNSSPDETAILRVILLRATVADSVLMVHPTLHSFSMNAQQNPTPVSLDSGSIKPDNVLLLDTFFEVLIHHGETLAAWRKEGYEDLEGYEHFKSFLDSARGDAKGLVDGRYPTPRLIEVNKGDPNARILYNRINPSRTHKTDAQYGNAPGELMYTDDASLQVFMEHLKKLAVQQ